MIDAVVKVGGGLLPHAEHLDAVLATICAAAHDRRLLIVPGGGCFADSVREADRQLGLSGDAAHWMAILAMDQYAHLIADRLRRGVLVADRHAISAALDERKLPVLAPFQWVRAADPLPHTWDVTSDSIAAWIAGELRAPRLVLVKPAGVRAGGNDAVVDAYFSRAVRTVVSPVIVAADRRDALRAALFD
jgi:aspartokinase-like uncharacterized kinase